MKKKITMVCDTETTGTIVKPLVYDIAYVITNKKGETLEERRFIVEEIFNSGLMETAYYAHKIPTLYANVSHLIKPFGVIISEMRKATERHKVTHFAAYNANFDIRAIANTYLELFKPLGVKPIWKETNKGWKVNYQETFIKKVFRKNLELLDIWSYACEVILTSRNYRAVADEQGWISPKGNYSTNAEKTYAYLTKNYNFIEEHTALEDARIETYILWRCEQRRKKHLSGILAQPWRMVQK